MSAQIPRDGPAETDAEEIEITDDMVDAGIQAFYGEALSWDGCSKREQRAGMRAAVMEVIRLLPPVGRELATRSHHEQNWVLIVD